MDLAVPDDADELVLGILFGWVLLVPLDTSYSQITLGFG
jgi:hypothetical protein